MQGCRVTGVRSSLVENKKRKCEKEEEKKLQQ
jgi:hypothetical protein